MQSRLASGRPLAVVMAVVAFVMGACSSPTVAPPVVVNIPPTIESVVVAGTRAEADSPIQVSATVKDTETPLGQLTYTWSASPQTGIFSGSTTFSGSQALITWRPPKGQKTPDVYTITLTVTEAYTSAGQAKQNSVSASTTGVRYNDSPTEVTQLGRDFLVNKFGNFNVSPAEAVSNFSDSCPGKAAEFENVEDNRANFRILSASFLPTPPTFNSTLTEGTVEGPCQFEDIPNSGANAGKREFVSGTCVLTTVYENFRWYLCDSFFKGPYQTAVVDLKGRVPGRIR
jgi:hypothetical protein